jgi:hypothetical protein
VWLAISIYLVLDQNHYKESIILLLGALCVLPGVLIVVAFSSGRLGVSGQHAV